MHSENLTDYNLSEAATRGVCKKSVLKNFAKFTRKHLSQNRFFNKVFLKIDWHRCFPVNYLKFLRLTIFIVMRYKEKHDKTVYSFDIRTDFN